MTGSMTQNCSTAIAFETDRSNQTQTEGVDLVSAVTIDTETHLIFRMWPVEANPDYSRVFRLTSQEHSGDLLVDEMDRANVDHAIVISYDAIDLAGSLKQGGSTPE